MYVREHEGVVQGYQKGEAVSKKGVFTFWSLGALLLGALVLVLSKFSGRPKKPSFLL